MQAVYGITNVIGPFAGSLPTAKASFDCATGQMRSALRSTNSSEPPWPVSADVTRTFAGARVPQLRENEARAWAASV
jgi:hypothetical protein